MENRLIFLCVLGVLCAKLHFPGKSYRKAAKNAIPFFLLAGGGK